MFDRNSDIIKEFMCRKCHLYAAGAALLEVVLSRANCFRLLRITSWSFCFTRELATAPLNQSDSSQTPVRHQSVGVCV